MKSNNAEIYKETFISSLSIDQKNFSEDLKYNEIEEWDSIGHMTLIAALEEKFSISIDTDDIVDFSSFKKGKEILKKYKIPF
ncbi:acyl carrier protein [Candidatus Pelagibacter sp.]|nr:acyl carrier protein [Candidatus Pelagibacter sp.]|tara:strand:- start:323 stop:568 length:246 start_codon:yes stop_codon:yes gene_type:complete